MAISKIENASLAASAVGQSNMGTGVVGTGPAFSVYQSVGTVINNGTTTKVVCNVETFDTNSSYDTSLSRFQPTVAGFYQVQGEVCPSAATAAGLTPIIYKNGVNVREGSVAVASGRAVIVALLYFNGASDYAELYAYNGTGANLTLASPAKDTVFEGFLVRAA